LSVREVIGVFDGSLVMQVEDDEPEEALFIPVSDDGLPMDDGFEEDKVEKNDFNPIIQAAERILLHKGSDMMAKVLDHKHDAMTTLLVAGAGYPP